MTRLLRQRGISARALNADPLPESLSFLQGDVELEPLRRETLDVEAQLVFVDCADERRVGSEASALFAGRALLGNIDHHISNTEYASCNVVDSASAATCEIIAGLAYDFGWSIDAPTAQALLTGIMTDTGRFSYVATSSRVFELCARLVECGARPHVAAQSLYSNEPFSRLKLLQRFLGTLRTEFDGKLGVGKLSQQDFLDTGSSYEETEGFVDFTRAVRGAKVGLYLEERKTTVKASLRSESADYRVDLIAKAFGGGGHACAAAFSAEVSIEELEPAVIAAIGIRIKELATIV